MKPVNYDYQRPTSLQDASRLLNDESAVTKAIAGGQSLGPMLNLRLAQPDLLVDLGGIPEMVRSWEDGDAVVIGACTTHAAIEDGRTLDPTRGILSSVASGIAYRPVRNRGTIGGSIVHADPAADWVVTLTALGAEILITGREEPRKTTIGDLMLGPYEVDMKEDEIVTGIRLANVSTAARWNYFKFCRKVGEFAESMAAVFEDPERSVFRGVVGATDSRPIIIEDLREVPGYRPREAPEQAHDRAAARAFVMEMEPTGDPVKNHMLSVAFERALLGIAS
jgi:carbon-monoxide dehydrogenase medium subunit